MDYLRLSGRSESQIQRVEDQPPPRFSDELELELNQVEPSLAGPKRPQDRIALGAMAQSFNQLLKIETDAIIPAEVNVEGEDFSLQ